MLKRSPPMQPNQLAVHKRGKAVSWDLTFCEVKIKGDGKIKAVKAK